MKKTIGIQFNRKRLIAGSAAFMVGALAITLFSQDMTLTTFYPVPTGIFNQITTTGGDPANPTDTILARDGGKVGIGTANPKYTLDVNGAIAVEGARTYLLGKDEFNFHWIMAGGTHDSPTPPSDNALGFDIQNRLIYPGPGWTLQGVVKATQGTFYPTCPYACDGTNGPPYVKSTTIFTSFTPDAAYCSPGVYFDDSVVAAFIQLNCMNTWITLGPNYVTFLTVTIGAPMSAVTDPGKININYLIVGH